MDVSQFRAEVIAAREQRGKPRIFTPRYVELVLLGETDHHLIAVLCGVVVDKKRTHKEPVVLHASKQRDHNTITGFVATVTSGTVNYENMNSRRSPVTLEFDGSEQNVQLPETRSNEPATLNGVPITILPLWATSL